MFETNQIFSIVSCENVKMWKCAVSPPSGARGRVPKFFDFRLSERLNVTIWMLDEESPDNNHTRFRQTSAINAIFIGRTLKLFRKILRTSAISFAILFPVFRTNRSAWANSFFQPRSQIVCFDPQNQNLFNFLQQTLWITVKRTELVRANLFK